ncbi:spore protein [Paenibacillus sp. NPDC058174]
MAKDKENKKAARNKGRENVAPESAGFDKKLDGPNRPST